MINCSFYDYSQAKTSIGYSSIMAPHADPQTVDNRSKPTTGIATAFPQLMAPMLASNSPHNFKNAGWLYEPKLDGFRGIAVIRNGHTELFSKRGLRMTDHYPSVCRMLAKAVKFDCILDGELVAFDENGQPSFDRMQLRMNLSAPRDLKRADQLIPVGFYGFDIMHARHESLIRVPLLERKQILAAAYEPTGYIQQMSFWQGNGDDVYKACLDLGFEGVIAKRANSIYEPGKRSAHWVKIKPYRSAEFIICGYTRGSGIDAHDFPRRRTKSNQWHGAFGSLLLGQYDNTGMLVYRGSVGNGFTDAMFDEMATIMAPLVTTNCPFAPKPTDKRDVVWLAPHIVAEVKFMTWTSDGKLRIPIFRRFRPDLQATDIRT
jgi:bifunctional non-homologous end joining protein LigD